VHVQLFCANLSKKEVEAQISVLQCSGLKKTKTMLMATVHCMPTLSYCTPSGIIVTLKNHTFVYQI